MYKLILLRHGQSEWNKENRFTGWKDVGLSEQGVEEAKVGNKDKLHALQRLRKFVPEDLDQ